MPAKSRVLLFAIALGALGQSGAEKIWEGVFTAAQADRGREVYLKNCSNCHNLDLAGSVRGPALRGERFMLAWQNGSVNNLFRKIRDSMPANYPETVSEEGKLDVISYLLKENGFPTGASELKLDAEALESIQIVQKGSQGVPNFALVQMVGCLERGPGKTWMLTRTSDPVVTREDTPTASMIGNAASQALGSGSFLLVSAGTFQPEAHVGHRMEARGLIYRDASGNRLNLTSLRMADESCAR
jgi:mono/diheme cytochrome c family protein